MLLCFYVFQGSERPLVVNHIENPSTFPAISSHTVTYSAHNDVCSSSSGDRITELAEEEEDKENSLHVNIHLVIIQTKPDLVIHNVIQTFFEKDSIG